MEILKTIYHVKRIHFDWGYCRPAVCKDTYYVGWFNIVKVKREVIAHFRDDDEGKAKAEELVSYYSGSD